jgi:RNA recognition motif-containing protein
MKKLFIGGFPLDITELELVQLVSPHGAVETIKIVRDRKTGICKGYAFLEMIDLAAAENAVAMLSGTMLAGRELTLNIVEEIVVVEKRVVRPVTTTIGAKPKRPRLSSK